MNNIALIGAPSSGKTKLGEELISDELKNHRLIDGYAQDVQDYTTLALGPYATYIGNLLVLSERLQEEVAAVKEEVSFISCGTVIETAVYMALRGGIIDESHRYEHARIGLFMNLLGVILNDFNGQVYDHIFFLPLVGDNHSDLNKKIESQIRDALSTFDVPYLELPNKDRYEKVLEAIDASSSIE